jgi:hypothetical protein
MFAKDEASSGIQKRGRTFDVVESYTVDRATSRPGDKMKMPVSKSFHFY